MPKGFSDSVNESFYFKIPPAILGSDPFVSKQRVIPLIHKPGYEATEIVAALPAPILLDWTAAFVREGKEAAKKILPRFLLKRIILII